MMKAPNIFIHSVQIYILALLALMFAGKAAAQSDCDLKKDKDNIKVYTCITEGSDFKTVRAEFVVKATIDQYVAIVLDVDRYKEWHFRTVNPRLLKRVSNSEIIYYTQVSAPWPVSNRDLILHLNLDLDSATGVLIARLKSLPDYIPEVEGIVRIPKSYSELKFTPIDKNTLKVDYFIHVDPGGQIPAWVANMVSTQGPYETFKNLIDRLEHPDDSSSASKIIDL